MTPFRRRALGALALLFYAIHAGWHLRRGAPDNLLWICHAATVAVGAGLLLGRPSLNAIGVLWLSLGVPLWILDMATGGERLPTSVLTHVGGFAIGIAGAREMGSPAGSWWRAVAALFALQVLTRAVGTPAENVNLAFAVWTGWERCFPSYPAYWAFMLAVSAATFFVAEAMLRRIPRERRHEPA